MATKEDIEEAAQLRFLALQSMVKRIKKTSSNNVANEINNDNYDEDSDIKLLRTAALKTITNKSKVSLINNKDIKLEKCLLVNEKKRCLSDQEYVTKNKKSMKLNNCNLSDNANNRKSSETSKNYFIKEEHCNEPHDMILTESPNKQVPVTQEEIIKVVRNGSMQLSNLDSKKVDETMILHITFSSSDDSSSDSSSEIVDKYNKKKNNLSLKQPPSSKKDVLDNLNGLPDTLPMNGFDENSCMKRLAALMRNCESEIGKRNEQVKILLDAYDKYQSHNQTLCNILQAMKSVRDELSKYSSESNNDTSR